MPKKQILKIIVDILMTAALLLLMSYSLFGEAAHEWAGTVMFVLFVVHHILNRRWRQSLFKGWQRWCLFAWSALWQAALFFPITFSAG